MWSPLLGEQTSMHTIEDSSLITAISNDIQTHAKQNKKRKEAGQRLKNIKAKYEAQLKILEKRRQDEM